MPVNRGIEAMRPFVSGCVALGALFLVSLGCGMARAADGRALAEEEPHAPYNWTGPYFGVSVGVAVNVAVGVDVKVDVGV